MRPLHAFSGGLLLLALDFRATSLDLLPDVVGWLLIGWAAWCWRERSILGVAVVGTVASLPLVALPYHYVQYDVLADRNVVVSPGTDLGYPEHLEYDLLTGARLAAYALSAAAAAVVVVLTVRFLSRRAGAWAGPSTTRSLRRLRVAMVAFVVVWSIPRLVAATVAVDDGLAPIWDDPAAKVALIGAVVAVAVAIAFGADAREPWARSVREFPHPVAPHDKSVVDQ